MARLSAKEVLAVLQERIDNLGKRFDKFEEKQEEIVKACSEISKNVNDLSHAVDNHSVWIAVHEKDVAQKQELSLKWKLAIASSLVSVVAFILRELVALILRSGIP